MIYSTFINFNVGVLKIWRYVYDTFTSLKTLVNISGHRITSPKTLANLVELKNFTPSPKTLGLENVKSNGGNMAQASSKEGENPNISAKTIPSPSSTSEAQVYQERSLSVDKVRLKSHSKGEDPHEPLLDPFAWFSRLKLLHPY